LSLLSIVCHRPAPHSSLAGNIVESPLSAFGLPGGQPVTEPGEEVGASIGHHGSMNLIGIDVVIVFMETLLLKRLLMIEVIEIIEEKV
jgi:hypothetical protein